MKYKTILKLNALSYMSLPTHWFNPWQEDASSGAVFISAFAGNRTII